ncbi:MAG TPA: hypothetical protein VD996_11075, partial [Chitinophagaceae bacterium]|nr:hypothetical protein [Chitinophagaceae bacterium]
SDSDKEGFFIKDKADTTTADDAMHVIVTDTGIRYKRFGWDKRVSSSDVSMPIEPGKTLLRVLVKPTTTLASFKVGTTSGADNVVPEVFNVPGGSWSVFSTTFYSEAGNTLYFNGLTSSTEVLIYKQ